MHSKLKENIISTLIRKVLMHGAETRAMLKRRGKAEENGNDNVKMGYGERETEEGRN